MMRFRYVHWLILLLLVAVVLTLSWLVSLQPAAWAQASSTAIPGPSGSPTPVPTVSVPQRMGNSLQLIKEISPPVLSPGQEATARLRVRGLRLGGCAGAPGRPVDAMLVIDNSASAGRGLGSNLERTQVWAANFLDHLSQPIYSRRDTPEDRSRAGLIINSPNLTNTFPLLVQPLTDDLEAVRSQVSALGGGGDVGAADLIHSAANQLIGRDPRRAGLILLFLHDRQPLQPGSGVEQAIREAQQIGIKVYLIVNNDGVPSADRITTVDLEPLLQPNEYWFDPSPDQLRAAFVQAADGVMDLSGRDILLTDQFLDPSVATILDVGQGGYQDGNRVVWNLHHLRAGDEVVLTYRFYIPPTLAPGQYMMHTGGAYLDCNGYLFSRPAGDPAQLPLLEYQATIALPTPTPMVILFGTPVPLFTPTPVSIFTQTHPFLEVEHGVNPPSGLFRQDEYTITVTLYGTGEKCPPTVRRYPVDAVLVLDHSGSMGGPFGASWKLEEAKRAAIAFVEEFARGSRQAQADRVGVIAFDDGADLVHELSEDQASLRHQIEQIDLGGGTDIANALQLAFETLSHAKRPRIPQVIVLLSDGQSDYTSAMHVAQAIKDEEIRIVTVGLGYDVDDHLMRDIASDLSDYYFAAPGESLEEMFRNIAIRARQPIAATNIRVVHAYDSERFEVVRGSPNPPASTDQPGKVIWQIDQVDEPNTVLTYRIRPKVHGLYPVLNDAEVIFTSCEARDETLSMAEDDRLEANTLLPSKVLTTTLPVTTNVQINPPPYGTVQPPPAKDWRLRLCNAGLCWPLALALFLLFLLAFLFLTRWGRQLRNWFRGAKLSCKLLSLLLLLWLLFLVPLLAKALSTGVCADQQTLIFWRIAGQESRLYYARPAPVRQVVPFEVDRHERECVGCHIVSGSSKLMAISAESSDDWAGELTIQRTDGAAGILAGLRGSYFSWSPDGHKLAYSHHDRDIYIMDLDTRLSTPLPGASDPSLVETMPAWSADGATIAFVRPRDPTSGGFAISGPCDIYTVSVAGGEPVPLAGASEGGLNYYPQYSPNGRWLLFTSAPDGSSYANPQAKIFVMPATGGKPIPLPLNDLPDGTHIENAANSWATWSPDGTQIYFNSKREGDFNTYVADFIEEKEETQAGVVYHPTTGPARPIAEANTTDFEHLATYVGPAEPITIWQMIAWAWPAIRRLWPFLLLFPLLLLLWWWFCRAEAPAKVRVPRDLLPPPAKLSPWDGPKALWQPDPALVIGLGGTGRRVLAYLKKNLLDAGAGRFPRQVQFMLIDTADEEPAVPGQPQVEFTGVKLEREADGITTLNEDLDPIIARMGRQEDSEPELKSWFPAGPYQALPEAERHLSEGTRQRRPMARAGLFREIQLRSDKPGSLWQRLLEGARTAQDEQRNLRVVLISSLAGGLGSGILADIAYLVRRAGKLSGARLVTVEAYLATDKAFSALMDDRTVAATNTYAALRELQRLQMAGKQPYPIRYKHAPGDEVLDGRCEWPLLDEIYLFDGGQLMGEQPVKWLYPTMADSITLLLDPVSREGGALYRYRQQIRGNATREQEATGQAVVSGLGSFQVRTPLPDMVESLATRWARELLTLLLMGEVQEGLVLRPTQNQEEDAAKLSERIREFLAGDCDYKAPIPGAIDVGVIEQLAKEEIGKQSLQSSLKRMVLRDKETERRTFHAYLNATLGYILNGSSQSKPLVARSGKVAYCLAFLNMLEEEMATIARRSQGITGLGKVAQARLKDLAELLPVYQQEVIAARKSLEVQRDLIVPPARITPESERLGTVLGRLEEHRQWLLRWRANMNEIRTRRYLGYEMQRGEPDDATLNEWYDRYLHEQLEGNLDRLFWQQTPEGEVKLVLRSWDDEVLQAEQAALDRFTQALLDLARYVARDIWDRERGALARLLKEEMASTRQAERFVDHLWAWSEPLLQCNLAAARNSTLHVALAGTSEALQASDIEKQLLKRQQAGRQLTTLPIADPCALTTVQTQDVVPLSASYAAQDACEIYQSQKGLLWGHEPTAVFAAEENARRLEIRLPEIRQQPRILHPIVVAGLEDISRARLYALAYAGNYVILDQLDRVFVRVPDRPALQLTGNRPTDAADPLHPLVLGLVRFSELPDEQIQPLAIILDQPTDEMVRRWRAWIGGVPREDVLARDGRPEAKDLGDVMALLVREAVLQRQRP